jgi:diguanylate cyclase (GGDEF)-like protein/PAS domain S-box-containing protein
METPLHVLIIADSEADALLLLPGLRQGGYAPVHERVATAADLRAALGEQSWDAILCDTRLSGFNAREALAVLRKTDRDVPFIAISGMAGEEAAVELMKAGAHDYIRKDQLHRLVPAIERELREAALRREHRRTERALRESERKFRLLVEGAPDAIYVQSGGRFAYLNPAAVRLFGAPSAEALLGRPILERISPPYHAIVRERIRLGNEEKKPTPKLEQQFLRLDGTPVDVEVSAVPFTYENQNGGLAFVRDIGERKRAEEERNRSRQTAERLAKEMAVIAEIGRIIGTTLNIDEVYERFAAEARKLIPFDRIIVNLNTPEGDQGCVTYVSGLVVPGKEPGACYPLQGSVNEALSRSRSSLILQPRSMAELIARFPGLAPNYRAGIRSMLCVPLISRDKVFGVLHFQARKPRTYSDGVLPLAERIAAQIAGAIANVQLFADLRRAQASLQENETRLRAIFDQAAVGVAEIDVQTGRFLSANRHLCEMLGRSEQELKEVDFLAVTHPEDHRLHEEQISQLAAGKIPRFTLEKRYLRKNGEPLWVNLAISPLWRPGEKPGHNLIIVQDITANKRMQEEIENRSRQLAALHEMSLDLAAELDLNALLHAVVQRALNLIGGTTCNCYLYEAKADHLERVVSAGQGLVSRKTTRQRGEGLVGVIWETGQPLLVNDYPSWPGRVRVYASAAPRSMIGAPIRWGGEFLGVLNIMGAEKNRFTRTDVDTLGMFATQAAIAIRNARIYKQIEQTAVTDVLTGLFNRRGFLQLGEREFDRAMRLGRPLAALLIDIDHFKAVNDRFGHHTGDQVLQALAACLGRNSRAIDVAGRYGGEEFVLLLPDTLPAEAIRIAERLRESIAKILLPAVPLEGALPETVIGVTASIGVAALTPETRDLAFLIDRADQAQYRAKNAGRNRVCLWETQERAIGEKAEEKVP